ncbi:MAG: hypothetical protein QF785_04550 [Phycisphaeraceae bacterium]|jgi:hypothetical protein|nr:hypothetical protein [Phycisphaeraceae bacterium]MDP7347155.1 hypothetical protein [Phycisphaeraceae bacterium]
MRRWFCKLGTAGLATFLTGWFCIAPVVVLCTCLQGHAAYALHGHAEPACGEHEHESQREPPLGSGNQHDHEDAQVSPDELLARSSNPTRLVSSVVCIGVTSTTYNQAGTFLSANQVHRAHGPPKSVCTSITSTVLLM